MTALPIGSIRDQFLKHLAQGPVVVSAPTGSGKSTEIPRWIEGRVLVVEPRRVACRTLAQRVAELEGCPLGETVGYHVRDECRAGPATRILFATPGIVLRILDEARAFDAVVLDEFHERRLDVDLLLALFRGRQRLTVMSATIDGARIATHLDGTHLHAETRQYPVETRYAAGGAFLPESKGLVARVTSALDEAEPAAGDVLVFLPGKAEIAVVGQALRSSGCEVLPLHGGLSLDEQARAFRPCERRKVILATNVAETSVTVPGIGVVIDTGLVRRTRYHQGRGFLTLAPIAWDSAEQRAGRAGRTRPGVALRLWSSTARLESTTPAEIHRESLVPLVLAASACGVKVGNLSFLDPPKEHAVDAAEKELNALGALDEFHRLTACGRELFGLPLDASLGRLLVEAKRTGASDECVDLVAALAVGRPLFVRDAPSEDDDDDLRGCGCDITALVRAVRFGKPAAHHLSPFVLAEARAVSHRLRRALSLPVTADPHRPLDRELIARTAMSADPRCVHIARKRKSRVAWSNGGTEIALARESAVNRLKNVEAIAVLDSRAVGIGPRETRILATCATALPMKWLEKAGLGRDRIAKVSRHGDRLVATIERVYAKRVIAVREQAPTGALAREAVLELFLRGSLFPEALKATKERLEARALATRLASRSFLSTEEAAEFAELPPGLRAWAQQRIEHLGVECGDDLALLVAKDFLAPDIPPMLRRLLDREFPRELRLGDGVYEVNYDLSARQVVLRLVQGHPRSPPSRALLPRFPGFRVHVEIRGAVHIL